MLEGLTLVLGIERMIARAAASSCSQDPVLSVEALTDITFSARWGFRGIASKDTLSPPPQVIASRLQFQRRLDVQVSEKQELLVLGGVVGTGLGHGHGRCRRRRPSPEVPSWRVLSPGTDQNGHEQSEGVT